ncbi:MAG: hypothetical protein IJ640_07235 [Prevotella sp.]|nr:hypothetical protein [Prevotella sp.]
MTSKIEEYAKGRWYITISGDSVIVKKGRCKRTFKISKYESQDSLIADIEAYMNDDVALFNKKYK